MTYGDLVRPWYGADEILEVVEVEVMAGVEAKAELTDPLRTAEVVGDSGFRPFRVTLGICWT